jgi:DNA-binding winged helix-turn-helix (wHTH) protein
MSIRIARLDLARIAAHPGKRAKSAPRAMADDDVHGNLRFGPFDLSSRERVLRRDGVVLPLGSRAIDILIYLAERPGKVIAKQELIDHVWSDVTVEEGSIRVHVAAIRKALGDGQFGNRYIANIKGRGLLVRRRRCYSNSKYGEQEGKASPSNQASRATGHDDRARHGRCRG